MQRFQNIDYDSISKSDIRYTHHSMHVVRVQKICPFYLAIVEYDVSDVTIGSKDGLVGVQSMIVSTISTAWFDPSVMVKIGDGQHMSWPEVGTIERPPDYPFKVPPFVT